METKTEPDSRSCSHLAHGAGLPTPARPRFTVCLREALAAPVGDTCTIFVIDHDRAIRKTMRDLFESNGYEAQLFADCSAFLESHRASSRGCVLVDELMLRMSGVKLIERLRCEGNAVPTIVMSSKATLPKAVQAMRAGASDFIEKPVEPDVLLSSVKWAIEQADAATGPADFREMAARRIANLTPRQHQILDLVLADHPSKNIAADLGISQRTVENHRAEITRRSGSKSMSGMIHTAICANCSLKNQTAH